MEQNKNSAKIYTTSSQGNLNTSFNDTQQIINVTNNRAKSYEELAAKYRDEAKKYRDEAQKYAEQNSNITMDDIIQVQTFLQGEIDMKQPLGEYALVSQLPENVSDLNNDAQYSTKTELANLLPSKTGCAGKFLKTDGTNLQWANLCLSSLFDTKLSDHILEGDEALGWALQGTYTLASHTSFYQKCLAEKNAGVATQTTLGWTTITTYNNANGHIFYNIADKAAVDTYYNQTGVAWFYGIDTENQRIFLPRNKWLGIKGVANTVPVIGNGKVLGLSNGYVSYGLSRAYSANELNAKAEWYNQVLPFKGTGTGTQPTSNEGIGVVGDPNTSGLIANTSGVIQVDTDKYLYICVGNTMVNQADFNVASLTVDVQNLETNKANLSEVSALAAPSARRENLTIGADGADYTAPAAGYFTGLLRTTDASNQASLTVSTKKIATQIANAPLDSDLAIFLPVAKGDVCQLGYRNISTDSSVSGLYFVYAEGSDE